MIPDLVFSTLRHRGRLPQRVLSRSGIEDASERSRTSGLYAVSLGIADRQFSRRVSGLYAVPFGIADRRFSSQPPPPTLPGRLLSSYQEPRLLSFCLSLQVSWERLLSKDRGNRIWSRVRISAAHRRLIGSTGGLRVNYQIHHEFSCRNGNQNGCRSAKSDRDNRSTCP